MKILDLMSTDVITVSPETPLKDVAFALAEHSISGLPVCDADGRVLGVISEADILYKERGGTERRGGPLAWILHARGSADSVKADARTAGEAMSSPPLTIAPSRPAAAAARMMLEHGVNRLPVVKDEKLIGIVTRADLVRAFTRTDAEIRADIEDILRRALWLEPGSVEIAVERGDVVLRGEVETRSAAEVMKQLVLKTTGVVTVDSKVRHRVDDVEHAPLGVRRR
jgi:CBS domain-containing protein